MCVCWCHFQRGLTLLLYVLYSFEGLGQNAKPVDFLGKKEDAYITRQEGFGLHLPAFVLNEENVR